MRNSGMILVVDDDLKLLDSLGRLLRLNGYSVQTFGSSASILSYGLPNSPCCALVDVRMPGFSGVELQSWLARTRPELPVILMTAYGDIPQAVQAIRAGAADFLTKPIEERRLLHAVKRAFAQEQRLRLEQETRVVYEKRFATLSPREKEVCAFVVEGKLNKQIAGELGTCEKTVKVHRGRVMKKMKVQSVAELVKAVLKLRTAAPPVRTPMPAVNINGAQPDIGHQPTMSRRANPSQ